MVERAGLPWNEARQALANEDWRQTAERNRAEMFSLGLWGVPSFRMRDTVVWGQDRLWAVQEALLGLAAADRPGHPQQRSTPHVNSRDQS